MQIAMAFYNKSYELSDATFIVGTAILARNIETRTIETAQSLEGIEEWKALDWIRFVAGIPLDTKDFSFRNDYAKTMLCDWIEE